MRQIEDILECKTISDSFLSVLIIGLLIFGVVLFFYSFFCIILAITGKVIIAFLSTFFFGAASLTTVITNL